MAGGIGEGGEAGAVLQLVAAGPDAQRDHRRKHRRRDEQGLAQGLFLFAARAAAIHGIVQSHRRTSFLLLGTV